jgi:hypothetical protein
MEKQKLESVKSLMKINVKTEPLTVEMRYLTKNFKSGNDFLDQFITKNVPVTLNCHS